MFSQRNYGIVTRIGFWLILGTKSQSYMITSTRAEDFSQIVEIMKLFAQQGLFATFSNSAMSSKKSSFKRNPKLTDSLAQVACPAQKSPASHRPTSAATALGSSTAANTASNIMHR
jgi:hypothetical protein